MPRKARDQRLMASKVKALGGAGGVGGLMSCDQRLMASKVKAQVNKRSQHCF